LCISWIIKWLIIINARCKHEDTHTHTHIVSIITDIITVTEICYYCYWKNLLCKCLLWFCYCYTYRSYTNL